MTQRKAKESTPLMDDICGDCNKAYNIHDMHCKLVPRTYGVGQVIVDYEPLKFSSMRVFLALKGTILQDSVLVVEQVLITILFFCAAFPVWYTFHDQATGVAKDMTTRKWFASQESRMRDFARIMMTLAALLLTIYLGFGVGRWWVIRSVGVGGIKSAQMELSMMVSQLVTQEAEVLSAIRRYARASLILVFLWRRKLVGPTVNQDDARKALQELVQQGLLTVQEVNQLVKWNHCLHETIWAWQSAIIATLHQEGKIKSDPLLRTLLERCSDGRQAVQVIHTHLAVKLPMQYSHMLGFLVKMHNVVLAVIMGALFGAAVRNKELLICAQLFGRTLILPLLFNAILLINAELSDPFAGTAPTDFPAHMYSMALENDGSSIVEASRNMPYWMAQRNPLPV